MFHIESSLMTILIYSQLKPNEQKIQGIGDVFASNLSF